MHIRADENEHAVHVDFVPMVDVLFNLLIFFLLATSFYQVEREMNIALPQAGAAGPISSAMREIIINVDGDGAAWVAGKQVEDEDLASMVRAAIETNPEQKVSVRGDRNTPYANVARVLDLCKGAGVTVPYLDTIPIP